MLFLLDPHDPDAPFPDIDLAEREPNGLLALGGDLSVARLLHAYRQGIFPWFSHGDPILWWSPDPRNVLYPDRVNVSRSLRKTLRKRQFGVTLDRDFEGVIAGCAAPREDAEGTWLVPEMIDAYMRLHLDGHAHSVEVWHEGRLSGGLYGVAIGRVFFGESMFTRVSDASKVALVQLCRTLAAKRFELVDCQVVTGHLERMGATTIPRQDFRGILDRACNLPGALGSWDDGRIAYPEPGTDQS